MVMSNLILDLSRGKSKRTMSNVIKLTGVGFRRFQLVIMITLLPLLSRMLLLIDSGIGLLGTITMTLTSSVLLRTVFLSSGILVDENTVILAALIMSNVPIAKVHGPLLQTYLS